MTLAFSINQRLMTNRTTAMPSTRRTVRRRTPVETTEYLKGLARFIRAAGRRVADSDEIELEALLGLRTVLDEAIQTAVDGQLRLGKSWADIAAATGKSTQAAHKRWGKKKEADA